MDIYEHIKNDNYKNQMTYPSKKDFENKDDYIAARHRYSEETRRLEAQFKADLLAYHEVVDHPKADLCFNLAWEHGHASGYSEVANYFSEFVELIK